MTEGDLCAVVTGGAMGVGAGIVRRLATAGFRVAMFDRDLTSVEMIASQLNGLTRFFQVGVSEEASVKKGIKAVLNA